ncbi:MAG: hypothetical protein Q8P02_04860 [Candidatus Micrarchaeota archaeon]|nr:hypothetical protein [Candidatus Micrarchaeota archaeon]
MQDAERVIGFFGAALLLQFSVGGNSFANLVAGPGLLFAVPFALMNALSNAFPLAAPLFLLAMPLCILSFYRQAFGAAGYMIIYGCMVVLMLA